MSITTAAPASLASTAPEAAVVRLLPVPRREWALRWCFGCVAPRHRRALTLRRLARAHLLQLCPTCTAGVAATARRESRPGPAVGWIDPDETRALLDRAGRLEDRSLLVLLGAAA